ncbi:hypothetical protein DPMN_053391 [Dreissena polymorpha]|uniref:Uncharacterized protein n=1 Tax=Dreissena polymorpha TaxID=45954 RepID=A0A9D4CMI5_DREPO|nr:hypothetical protein DPMN_053391 [Dreissena polymorpha]
MKSTSADRTIVDIGATTQKNKAIISSLFAAHALSGCDTVARLTGIGKIKVVKQLEKGLHLDHLDVKEASFDLVLSEATTFIAACYGRYNKASMSDVRYDVWLSTIGKINIRNMPKLQALPPTTGSFLENVKRAHLQTCIWKATLEQDPPTFNVTEFGWKKKKWARFFHPS